MAANVYLLAVFETIAWFGLRELGRSSAILKGMEACD